MREEGSTSRTMIPSALLVAAGLALLTALPSAAAVSPEPNPALFTDLKTADPHSPMAHSPAGTAALSPADTIALSSASTTVGRQEGNTSLHSDIGAAVPSRTKAEDRFDVEGRRVEGRPTLAGAPELRAGQYVDTVPPAGTEKYYLLSRKQPGSVLHVGVSGRPADTSFADSSLVVRLRTLGNGRCGHVETFDNDQPFARRNSVLSGAAVTWSTDDVLRGLCLDAEQVALVISSDGNTEAFAGRPFELTITEEPPLAGEGKRLPGPTDQAPPWRSDVLASTRQGAGEVTGGLSCNSATRLSSGWYRSSIAPGEARFYRVPLRWGQHLQAYVELADLTAGLRRDLDDLEQTMTLRLYGPSRGMAHVQSATAPASVGDVIAVDRSVRMAAVTLPVRYRNREGERDEQRAASLAGDYYLVVSLAEDKEGASYRVPFDLRVDALGEPTGAPHYAEGRRLLGPGASKLAMADSDPSPPSEPEERSHRLVPFLASLGLALLLFGAITLTVSRVREATAAELAEPDHDLFR